MRADHRLVFVLVGGSLALGTLSLLLPGALSYDPSAWVVWGREIAHGHLVTVDGPAWKPLPVLTSVPLSLTGEAAPLLWLAIARAGALMALLMAFRLARRLAPREMSVAAGATAAVGLLCTGGFLGYLAATGMSEPLLAALFLGAVERHLMESRIVAWVLLGLAALLRPEVWPFFLAYGAWLTVAGALPRRVLAIGVASLLVVWFVPDLLGSGNLLRSYTTGARPGPASPVLAHSPVLTVLHEGWNVLLAPVQLLATVGVVAIILGVGGRAATHERRLVALAGFAYLSVVAVMAGAGASAGDVRYLLPGLALASVLAGVGVALLPGMMSSLGRRGGERRDATGPSRVLRAAAAAVGLAAFGAALRPELPTLGSQTEQLRKQTETAAGLSNAVRTAGGRRAVLDCGSPTTDPFHVPWLAWVLHVPIGAVRSTAVFAGGRWIPLPPRPPSAVFAVRGADGALRSAPVWKEVPSGQWVVRTACRPHRGPTPRGAGTARTASRASAANMITNGSSPARKRGVSDVTRTVPIQRSPGTSQIAQGTRRAAGSSTPTNASSARAWNRRAPATAAPLGTSTVDAPNRTRRDPVRSSSRSVFHHQTVAT